MIRTFPHGLENNHACKWISDNFPGVLTYVLLSKIHLHTWSFSKPRGKVLFLCKSMGQIRPLDLILLKICPHGWSPNLRVQHIEPFHFSMVYGLLKGKFYWVVSLQGVDENFYKRILITDMLRQNFSVNSLLEKKLQVF